MAEFMIGTTQENMTNLADLATPIDAPRSRYFPYAQLKRLSDGSLRGLGFARAIWDFPFMTLSERNQMALFCPGPSARVYIRTKLNDDSYADFVGVLNWPEDEERWAAGYKQQMTFEFTNLEEL